jgi:predicted porin
LFIFGVLLMKKSLIALAVLAASGASFAQSNVTLYGTVDASLAHVKSGSTSNTLMLSGAVATSVFGFKGSEDLGSGLKANFKLEEAFDGSDGTATAGFSREAWVGFSGGFGEVKLGKVSSAYNDTEGAAGAVFGSGTVGPIGVVFESDIQEIARPTNTIYYSTPNFSGFTGSVSYSLDEKTAAVAADPVKVTPAVAAAQRVESLGLSYAAGPLYVGFGYQTQRAYDVDPAVKMTQVNVTYDLGVVKLLGAVGQVKNSKGISGDKTSEWQIGVDVPVSSALTVSAGYANAKYTYANGSADDKHNAFSVGAAYALSKRTTAYAAVETDKFDLADVKTDKYAVGVIHKF